MNRYIEFNPLKFLAEAPGWDAEIKLQQEKLETILELRGQSDGVSGGGEVSNPVEKINMAKAEIEGEIERLNYYKRVFRYVWRSLTDENRLMIEAFFYKRHGKVRDFVREYAEEKGTSTRRVYDARREAIEKFSEIVNEMFL